MLYNEFIQNIIDTRGQWNIPEGEYFEKHHILPKCLGGEGDYKNGNFRRTSYHFNCIWLTAQEHYMAHKLLFEENPNNRSLALAWHNFHQRKASKLASDIEISANEYAILKQQYTLVQSKYLSGKNSPAFGREHSVEVREKIKIARQKQAEIYGEPHAGKQHSTETKSYLSKHFRENPVHSIKIIDQSTGIIYVSKNECMRSLGIGYEKLNTCLEKSILWQNHKLEIYEQDKSRTSKHLNAIRIYDCNSGQIYNSKTECRHQTGISVRKLESCLIKNIEWNQYKFEIYNEDKLYEEHNI